MNPLKKIKNIYHNSPLLIKLNTLILAITVLLCASLLAFVFVFYHFMVSRRNEQSVEASVERAAYSLNQSYQDILQHFIRICSDVDFQAEVQAITDDPSNVHMHRQNLQTVTSDLTHSHYLISSVLIVSGAAPHYTYAPFSAPLRLPLSDVFTDRELSQIDGITWCSERSEPSKPANQVIPLVIPVENHWGLTRIASGSDSTPSAYVILFLDSDTLQSMLVNTGLNDQQLRYHLIRSDGTLISDMKNTMSRQIENTDEFSRMIAQLEGSKRSVVKSQYQSHSLFLHGLETSGLLLLCDLQRETFSDILVSTAPSFLLTLILIVALMMGTSYFMKRFVANPILKLNDIVEKIGSDDYNTPEHFPARDELGRLLEAINSMNSTINAQKQQIKEEEAVKYRTELKLLTEQINPHFLYNTLEEIQSEVFRNNNDIAASMIQYLADYLRISLSGGADIISISNELRHINAYINIMNQRFGQTILLVHKVDPALADVKILKTILQPLVENSIRHGFGIDSFGIPASAPMIQISFTSPAPGSLAIDIIDNGSGFDAVKVRQLMVSEPSAQAQRHVGVNNVYHRLITYYGKENIEVSMESIPYYQNRIHICIRKV
ncbi:MAG: histidine kinase [Hungatella sp.]|nr:histidine kinase [Hungatella sp.]